MGRPPTTGSSGLEAVRRRACSSCCPAGIGQMGVSPAPFGCAHGRRPPAVLRALSVARNAAALRTLSPIDEPGEPEAGGTRQDQRGKRVTLDRSRHGAPPLLDVSASLRVTLVCLPRIPQTGL